MRSKLTYANVMSTLAVVLAVAGGTSAVAGIKLGKGSVGKRELAKGAVTAKALGRTVIRVEENAAGGAVTSCAKGERLLSGGTLAGIVSSTRPSESIANSWDGAGSAPATVYALCLRK